MFSTCLALKLQMSKGELQVALSKYATYKQESAGILVLAQMDVHERERNKASPNHVDFDAQWIEESHSLMRDTKRQHLVLVCISIKYAHPGSNISILKGDLLISPLYRRN